MVAIPDPLPGATELVNQGWEYFQGKSGELLQTTQYSLSAIATPLFDLVPPVITYTGIEFAAGTFARPDLPELPTIPAVDTDIPAAPELSDVALDDLPAMPVEPDFSAMAWVKPGAPNVSAPLRPADTDVPLVEIDIPDAPAFTLPDDPTLYAITLPPVPDLQIPQFAGVRPAIDLQAPTDGIAWAYQSYDRGQVDEIRGQLSAMRIDGLALPPDIEQAIFDRARGREDALTLQQEQEVTRALAARGLRNPGGLLLKALQEVRGRARLTSSGASRDIGIEIARQNIEAIRFAISQGIAFESALLQDHLATQGLLLDAAKAVHSALVETFNGQVVLHNAQWEGFRVEAQVHETMIRALAVEVDAYKAQVDAQKAIGDVNESLVRAYGEKVRSLSALADMHRAQVEAAKAKGEINVQRLEQVRLRLQAYGIDIDAYAKQWDAHRVQVEAEATGLRYYETLGNVFGQRVSAWRGQVEAQQTRAQTQIAKNGQQIDLFRATLAGVATRVQAQTGNVDAITRVFQSQTGLYAAQGQVSSAESAAGDRNNELRLNQSRLAFEGAARNAEVAGNFALKKADLAIEAHRGAAQVAGQLTASVLSGVNMSAGTSQSGSVSFNYSGEI